MRVDEMMKVHAIVEVTRQLHNFKLWLEQESDLGERDPRCLELMRLRLAEIDCTMRNAFVIPPIEAITRHDDDCQFCNGRGKHVINRIVARQVQQSEHGCLHCGGTGKKRNVGETAVNPAD
jgi:hypothetical protein